MVKSPKLLKIGTVLNKRGYCTIRILGVLEKEKMYKVARSFDGGVNYTEEGASYIHIVHSDFSIVRNSLQIHNIHHHETSSTSKSKK